MTETIQQPYKKNIKHYKKHTKTLHKQYNTLQIPYKNNIKHDRNNTQTFQKKIIKHDRNQKQITKTI